MTSSHQLSAPGPLSGTVNLPGDKSMSHRAAILGLLSEGNTDVCGYLNAEDTIATLDAIQQLGATVEFGSAPADRCQSIRIRGMGIGSLLEPKVPLDLANSGTGARLLMGVVAGHDIEAVFTGDESLSRRPMGRITAPLCEMGAHFPSMSNDCTLPLTIRGTNFPLPMEHTLKVASAQVKSSILLCGLNSPGITTVIEPIPTRDHTEKMFRYFGADLKTDFTEAGHVRHRLIGRPTLRGKTVDVPKDPSSAAFIIAAAIAVPRSEVALPKVLLNPYRTGFLKTLQEMGGKIDIRNVQLIGGESVGEIVAAHSTLRAVDIPASRAPSMIDEYPILAILAALAQGTTRMFGLGELRVKESDRLSAIIDGLTSQGVNAWSEGDTLFVEGVSSSISNPVLVPGGGSVNSRHDHRIAMSFHILGLRANRPPLIDSDEFVATSFPSFFEMCRSIGMDTAADTRHSPIS